MLIKVHFILFFVLTRSLLNLQIQIGSDVFTLDPSSLQITQLVTATVPPSEDYTLIAAIFASFGASILLGVVMTILIMAWAHHKRTRTMKIHANDDKHFISEETNGQQVHTHPQQWLIRTLVMFNISTEVHHKGRLTWWSWQRH